MTTVCCAHCGNLFSADILHECEEMLRFALGKAQARIRELEPALAQLTADNIEMHKRGVCTPEERKVLEAMAELSDEWLKSDWATWRKPCDAELARRAAERGEGE